MLLHLDSAKKKSQFYSKFLLLSIIFKIIEFNNLHAKFLINHLQNAQIKNIRKKLILIKIIKYNNN